MSWQIAQLGAYTVSSPANMSLVQCTILGSMLLAAWLLGNLFIYRRLSKSTFYVSCLLLSLNTLAFIAFLGTVLDIHYVSAQTNQAIFITPGVSQDKLNTVVDDKSSNNKLFTLERNLDVANATYLSSPSLLVKTMPNANKIMVLGDGLSPYQWQSLFASQPRWGNIHTSSIAVAFTPGNKTVGLVDMSWKKQLTLGETLTISGAIQTPNTRVVADNNDVMKYSLQLLSPSGDVQQELMLEAGQVFNLNTQPRTAGQWLYKLQLIERGNEQNILELSDIAVFVEKPSGLRLAIWQSSPSFETKHLKDWVGAAGSQVTVVTQVSQDAYLRQTYNQPETAADDHSGEGFYNKQALDKTDILLIDGRGFIRLSADELTRLQKAVQDGLGLLIFADNDLASSNLNTDPPKENSLRIPTIQTDEQAADELAIDYADEYIVPNNNANSSQLLSVSALRFNDEKGDILLKAINQRTLVKRIKNGLGQVALTLLPRTYVWKLNETQEDYTYLWHYLFKKIARNTQQNKWQNEQQNQLTLVHTLVNACLISHNDIFDLVEPHALIERVNNQTLIQRSLFLNQRPEQPAWWCAHYWPESSGWHRIYTAKTHAAEQAKKQLTSSVTEQYRYVYPSDAWPSWQQSIKHLASTEVAASASDITVNTDYSPLHKGWFYGLLLLLLTLLWIARRLL
ncbi:hypothetical protein [Paraglaciecola sp. 20A4]|uniref:hypothetical protein n=1 Tax=Paraglaciecola sp. 20A4 TaxID=2687288 RepID=UPI00140DD7A4|nr:hypothetical protein [Paraglaciecola sp. 20A4]